MSEFEPSWSDPLMIPFTAEQTAGGRRGGPAMRRLRRPRQAPPSPRESPASPRAPSGGTEGSEPDAAG